MSDGSRRVVSFAASSMAGGAVAQTRLADGRADQGAAAGVMAAGAGVVGFSIRTDQGVGVAVGTAGCTDRDEIAVVEGRGRMQCRPGAGMAGRAIAGAGLADGRADQGAGCGVMAAAAGVVGLGRGTDQGVVVAAGATGRADSDDRAMINAAMRRRGC